MNVLIEGNIDKNSQVGKYYQIAKNCTTHLLFLVNDILDFAQLEENKIVLNMNLEVDLEQMIQESCDLLRFKAESKGLQLLFSVAPELVSGATFNTDGNRLKQILINLVSNAIKYTQLGAISISVFLSQDRQQIIISIKDTGVGIEHSRLEGLFTAFNKIMRYRELNQDGVGLGLTVSKNLAIALGGDITVDSKIGEGTTFKVTLPAKNIKMPNSPLSGQRTSLSKRERALTKCSKRRSSFSAYQYDETVVLEQKREKNFDLLRNIYLKENQHSASNLEEVAQSNNENENDEEIAILMNSPKRNKQRRKTIHFKQPQRFDEDDDYFEQALTNAAQRKRLMSYKQSTFSVMQLKPCSKLSLDSSQQYQINSQQISDDLPSALRHFQKYTVKFPNKARQHIINFRALLVDDEPFNLMVLEGFFRMIIPDTDITLDLHQAINGEQALKIILAQQDLGEPIDAVFTDHQMPVMGGSHKFRIGCIQNILIINIFRECPCKEYKGERDKG